MPRLPRAGKHRLQVRSGAATASRPVHRLHAAVDPGLGRISPAPLRLANIREGASQLLRHTREGTAAPMTLPSALLGRARSCLQLHVQAGLRGSRVKESVVCHKKSCCVVPTHGGLVWCQAGSPPRRFPVPLAIPTHVVVFVVVCLVRRSAVLLAPFPAVGDRPAVFSAHNRGDHAFGRRVGSHGPPGLDGLENLPNLRWPPHFLRVRELISFALSSNALLVTREPDGIGVCVHRMMSASDAGKSLPRSLLKMALRLFLRIQKCRDGAGSTAPTVMKNSVFWKVGAGWWFGVSRLRAPRLGT